MSAPSARRSAVSRSVLVALVAALASCTDAATIMLKVSDNTLLKTKGSTAGDSTATSVLKSSSEAFNFNTQNFSSVTNITDAENEDGTSGGSTTASDEDALSAVWYLAAFGGLVLFFFVVTCSELFFGNPIYTRRPVDLPHAGYLRRHVYGIRNQQQHHHHHHHHGHHYAPETPPPPYHLFAPPSYDDTVKSAGAFAAAVQQQQQQQHHHHHHHHQHQYLQHGAKKLADVYVVPVHRCGGAVTGYAVAAPSATTATATTTTAAAAAVDAKLLAAVLPPTKFK